MIAAAESSGVNLMYAQTAKFYPDNVTAKGLIDNGEVGDVIWIAIYIVTPGSPKSEEWHRWRSTGGGFFTYEGPHSIDQLRWLVGSDIDSVHSVGMGRYVSGGDGEDNGIAGFRFKNGVFAALLKGSSYPGVGHKGWNLMGTTGMLDVCCRSGKSG